MLSALAEVTISDATYERIVRIAAAAFPAEACGLLATKPGRSLDIVLYPATNVARGRDRFQIHRSAIAHIRHRIERDGLALCGCFHSHTHGPARPSPTDVRLAGTGFGFLWLIYSMATHRVGVFRRNAGRLTEVTWQRT